MTTLPILYSFRRCPYAMRARLALTISQTQTELREILLRDKAPDFLATSPKGTVPVLVTPTTTLEESLDIMLWALAQNDPDNWLENQTKSLALIATADGPFKTALDRTKYHSRHDTDPAEERAKAAIHLSNWNDILAAQATLTGAHFGLADAAIAPFVRQFANTDRAWFDAQPWPHLIAWLNAFLASNLFTSIMTKYTPWHSGQDRVLFP